MILETIKIILLTIIIFLMTGILIELLKIYRKSENNAGFSENQGTKIQNKTFKRTHNKITQANFENTLEPRKKAFDDRFKNGDGLFEPRKPKNGIEIKEKEE